METVNSASEVRIKLKKGGWEVEIACPEDKVKDVVESVLEGLSSRAIEISSQTEEKVGKGIATCRGLIEDLWHENWFSEERSLGHVHEELARRGYHYDRTAVSHSLTDLVRENVLTRVGTMRKYRYIQKKPHSPY